MLSAIATRQSEFDPDHMAAPRKAVRHSVCVIGEAPRTSQDITDFLGSSFLPSMMTFERATAMDCSAFDAFVIDAGMKTAADLEAVGDLLGALSHHGKPTFLAVGPSMRILFARMGLLSGVNVFSRPLQAATFTDPLAALLASRLAPREAKSRTRNGFLKVPEHAEALLAADEALELIFSLSRKGARLDVPAVERHSDVIVGSLAESGLSGWISGVREHHDMTYQHCLLVTGIAIAFGNQLGFRRSDLRRLAVGALLHDVGKARVPVGILDKPTALTAEEKQIIHRHPQIGIEMLAHQPAVPDEVRAIVLHHHEHLDGSGYPLGLAGENIPDIVRLMTIADVFGALIEKRAYKQPLSGSDAYDILLSMDGKLDMAFVAAVRSTALKAEG